MIFRILLGLLVCGVVLPARADSTLTTCTELTLRNAVAVGGIVRLNCPSGTVRLTRPLVVTRDTTILPGSEAMVISGDNVTRLFVVEPGVQLTISNVALFSGRHTGTNFNDGGIADTAGAGIYNNGGTVRLFSTTVGSHVVIGSTGFPGGPGLEAGDGEPGGDAAGAAVFNRGGTVIASNVVFQSNQATGGAGGNGGEGSGGLGGEGGDGGKGGAAGGTAIYSEGGLVDLFRCVFTNNVATGGVAGQAGVGTGVLGFHGESGMAGDAIGGAIAGDLNARVLVDSCSFVNNAVNAANGNNGLAGLRNLRGQHGRAGGNGAGGAIFISGTLQMTNSTLHGNSATGGNGGNGGAGAPDAFGSDGGNAGNGGYGSGGALDSLGTTRVINSTFMNNIASGGEPGAAGEGTGVADDGDAGQAGPSLGGSIYRSLGEIAVANTILVDSVPENMAGGVTQLGGNLNSEVIDVGVEQLTRHSEFILTVPLATNSPAINAGLVQFCPPVDQRGSNRWHQCDIGAFEYNGGMLVTPTNMNVSISASIGTTNLTNRLAIAWPTNAHNLNLFMATNVPTTNWTAVNITPAIVGANRVVTIATTNAPRRFFQLSTGTNTTSVTPPTPGLPPIPGS